MSGHPENSAEVNQMMEELTKHSEIVQVWCKGCEDWRPVNTAYAKYLKGEIEQCSRCRK